MNILYTLAGEGNGHAFRSSIVIDHLLKKGHNITIITSDKGYKYLSTRYKNVFEIIGLNIKYADNRVNKLETITSNISKAKDLPNNLRVTKEALKISNPDVVISDFEPSGSIAAYLKKVPLISIDNMHIMTDTNISVLRSDYSSFLIAKTITDAMLPGRDYTYITTFFYPRVKNKNTFLVPPLVRDEVLKLKALKKDHIFVYQTAPTNKKLMEVLSEFKNQKFIIYNGYEDIKSNNLVFKGGFKKGEKNEFIDDLRTSKAVIINGGFTLISEAIYLNKPILSMPIEGQYEQILNGRMIEKTRIGKMTLDVDSNVIEKWIKKLPGYGKNINKIKIDNNILFDKLDKTLEEINN